MGIEPNVGSLEGYCLTTRPRLLCKVVTLKLTYGSVLLEAQSVPFAGAADTSNERCAGGLGCGANPQYSRATREGHGVCTSLDVLMTNEIGETEGTRTPNQGIMSPLL